MNPPYHLSHLSYTRHYVAQLRHFEKHMFQNNRLKRKSISAGMLLKILCMAEIFRFVSSWGGNARNKIWLWKFSNLIFGLNWTLKPVSFCFCHAKYYVSFCFGIGVCNQSVNRKILRNSCPVCCHIICSGANKDKQCSPNILISVLIVPNLF